MDNKQKKIIMTQKLTKKTINKNVPIPLLEISMMYNDNPSKIMFRNKNTLKTQ